MAWQYIQYEYPIAYDFDKILMWISVDCHCYFALREKKTDSWRYFGGNALNALSSNLKLTEYILESDARSKYLDTPIETSGRVLAILPTHVSAKQVRLYIDDSTTVTVYEFRPSTFLLADEIMAGELRITDDFLSPPLIRVISSGVDRVKIGNYEGSSYGIVGYGPDGVTKIFELSDSVQQIIGWESGGFYIDGYVDTKDIELELMKINFQSISWAQFAIYDAFSDSTKRASPDPSTYSARVYMGSLDNGEDDTPDREFGFVTKAYEDITTVYDGTSTDVGVGYLEDTNKNWFIDECKLLRIVDSVGSEWDVLSNTSDTLTISGTPVAGDYHLKTANPTHAVAFCSFNDSVYGDGYGYVKMEANFDGTHWQTFVDSENSIDLRGSTVLISNSGNDYSVRFTLKNDGSGLGPYIYKFLVCTDPSVWRY